MTVFWKKLCVSFLYHKFGDKELTSKDVSYAWLKNGSLAGSDSMFTVTAVAGQRINIMCMISYKYDASLRAAKVYSEEFELVGKPGVDLGKVTDPENGARSKSLCFGDSVSHFSLMVDALVGVHDTLEWQQNVDGEIWTSIPDKYRADDDFRQRPKHRTLVAILHNRPKDQVFQVEVCQ